MQKVNDWLRFNLGHLGEGLLAYHFVWYWKNET